MIHYHLRKSYIITPINRRLDNVAGGHPRTPKDMRIDLSGPSFPARGQLSACSLAGAASCPPAPFRATPAKGWNGVATETSRIGGAAPFHGRARPVRSLSDASHFPFRCLCPRPFLPPRLELPVLISSGVRGCPPRIRHIRADLFCLSSARMCPKRKKERYT